MSRKLRQFLNRGWTKESADFCRKEARTSLSYLLNMTVLGMIADLILEGIFRRTENVQGSVIILAIGIILWVVLRILNYNEEYDPLVALYIFCAISLMAVITGDTLFMEGREAFFFAIFIFLIPQLITDIPWRIILFTLVFDGMFAIFEMNTKSGLILQRDLIRVFLTSSASILIASRKMNKVLRLVNKNTGIQEVAEHDLLTGVYNRAGGKMLIKRLIDERKCGTLAILDIDDFKHVNDTLGHQAGDSVLKAAGKILRDSFRSSDIVMRLGGDEFMVYAADMVDEHFAVQKMNSVCQEMHHVKVAPDAEEHISISMGCVINDGSYPDVDKLYRQADHMLYKKKREGKDGFEMLNVSYREP